jgi:hypothetical protein
MDKEQRLQMIREAAEKHRENTLLALGTTLPTRDDIQEEAGDLDSFREYERDLATEERAGINSDER